MGKYQKKGKKGLKVRDRLVENPINRHKSAKSEQALWDFGRKSKGLINK